MPSSVGSSPRRNLPMMTSAWLQQQGGQRGQPQDQLGAQQQPQPQGSAPQQLGQQLQGGAVRAAAAGEERKRERARVVRAHEFLLQQVQIAAIRRGLSDMTVALYSWGRGPV